MTDSGSLGQFICDCEDIYLYMKNKSNDPIHNFGLSCSLILIFAKYSNLEKDQLKESLQDVLKSYCEH